MGSFINPLSLIQAMQQQQEQPDPAPMRSPDPRIDTPEDDDSSIMSNFLRGFINRASAQGEPVKPEIFEERFRKSVSPGREFLANVLYGVSSGFTGEKFRDVRSRKFEEFAATEQMKQIAVQRQAQQAQIITQALAARERLGQQKELAEIRSIADKEKRTDAMSKFMLTHKLSMDKFEETQLNNDAARRNAKRPKDAGLDWALTQAKTLMAQEMNMDPNDPANEAELHQMASDLDFQRVANAAKIKAMTQRRYGKPAAAPRARLQRDKVTNGWGEIESGVYNLDAGTYNIAPDHWEGTPRDFSTAEVAKLTEAEGSVVNLRDAAALALRSPNSIGSFLKTLDPKWAAAIGDLNNTDQREIFRNVKNAISTRLHVMSGAAVSPAEGERLQAGIPAFFEKPDTFVPGIMGYAAMLEGSILRERAGISPSDIDFGGVVSTYLSTLQEEITRRRKAGQPLTDIPLPSGDEFMRIAAGAKGYDLVRDAKGRIRGIKPKAGK